MTGETNSPTGRLAVLALNDWYLPGYRGGGPVTSLRNLVGQLAHAVDFRIVTRDRDLGETSPYAGVRRGTWQPVEGSQVLYVRPAAWRIHDLLGVLRGTRHDVLYLNSFFSPRFTLTALLLRRLGWVPRRPTVLAVRGEFSPGALALKAGKKALYLRLARRAGLLRGVLFQATTEEERAYIRRVLGEATPVQVAPCLSAPSAAGEARTEREGGALRLVFLSRISPMKNLDFALDVLRDVQEPVELSIYGPVEDEAYWARCQAKLQALPAHIRVGYHGSVEPPQVVGTLRGHDALFLPTRGENFGHVIVEALSAGCAVLISDRTPWKDLEAAGCGWALPLEDPGAFARRIDELARLGREEWRGLSGQAVTYAARVTRDAAAVEQSLQMFRNAERSVHGA